MESIQELVPLLPSIAAIAYGSHETRSLKLWLAVSRTPAPERIEKYRPTKLVLGLAIFFCSLPLGVNRLLRVTTQSALDCTFVAGAYAFACWFTIAAFPSVAFNVVAVLRNANGTYKTMLLGARYPILLTILIAVAGGFFFAAQGIGVPGLLFGRIMTTAITRTFQEKKVGIRGAILMVSPCWVSLALRFDYHVHTFLTEETVVLTEAPGNGKEASPPGVIIPSMLPSFKKPTFAAAFCAFINSFILPLVIQRIVGFHDSRVAVPTSLIIGLYVSIPYTSLAIVASAFGKGNFNARWAYSETWYLPPTTESTVWEELVTVGEKTEEQPPFIDAV